MVAPVFKLSFTQHPEAAARASIKGAAVDPAASELLSGSDGTNNDLEVVIQLQAAT